MLRYDLGTGEYKNWIVSEVEFNPHHLGKCESIMALGNGYMGLRSSTEESYLGQVRNLFIAGTFNQFDEYEVTELPNAADVVELDIWINGEKFSLEKGKIIHYRRDLNVKTAELIRHVIWENRRGEQFEFLFRRFVSLKNLHLIGMKMEVTALNSDAEIKIGSGINGQMTNTGVQHFHEGEKRIFDKKYLQLLQKTTESKIDFVFNTTHRYAIDGEEIEKDPRMVMGRRKVFIETTFQLQKGQKLMFEKISNVYTSRDKEYDHENYSLEQLREDSLNNLKEEAKKGYDQLFAENVSEWAKRWKEMEITIESENDFDQLAIRFAHYHLIIMTPAHDNRFGVAAKGLTGEGYKGHSFWDTEIFILPFFTYTFPKVARSLLEYRYNTIEGARRKARANGYEGAMYPWESAFTGDEVTPEWGAVDIVTGKATKIWCGFIEQHITSDIAYAVWQYYQVTGDQDFMDRYGYEMLFDTATFWASRLEWNEEKQEYHINDVIGPDEYKEHVNNNAFTNYMAHWNIQTAIRYYEELKQHRPEILEKLNEKLNLDDAYKKWTEKVDKIYLPQPREEDLVIPQDDTYLTKQIIDLTKYKNQTQVGTIFEDYNMEQVNNIQVSKQADVMVLFYLLENKFSQEVKRANWNYYEPKTLHDSSLSLSTHCILASDMDDRELAYELFERAARIDLGPNMKSSDHGMHTASIGGIWQSVVCGFGGVRMLDGKLRINPKLPKQWKKLVFPIYWRGDRLEVTVTHETLHVKKVTNENEKVVFEVFGTIHEVSDEKTIPLT
ncbi:glycoside hydrolase family 65 protein [Thermolongibacillus altinsuensis]|uniref:glycoside hydrolase family 65 protein n=1 Tax=Thermolongibacillus altinsuensis TaxID=575256 RepID=UPI00242A2ED6|nr:glycoside hydrolase family 65 protein [Thermolongibacillus altinsuensis]GMB10124.1 glycosyl hydrolase family 65 [Thermolongibacillus altinsuensis]